MAQISFRKQPMILKIVPQAGPHLVKSTNDREGKQETKILKRLLEQALE